jgi:minor extracellular serine protease Vpr
MKRQWFASLTLVSILGFLAAAPPAAAVVPDSDGAPQGTGIAAGYAMVILSDPPLAEWPGAARAKNGKLDFGHGANGTHLAALAQARNAFKQWLRSTGSPAQVVREYDTVLNGVAVELNGASFDSLRAGPGVAHVEPSLTYRPTMNRSPAVIRAPAAWAAVVGGTANAGAGIKVGVLDTGIDQTHPFLTDPSLDPPFRKFDPGNEQFTSNKVIVARVYFTGRPGTFTAEALQDHGTHVSGTIAGVNGTPAPARDGLPAVSGLSGIAPKAFLGNYNVFPGDSGTATSHDIAQAIDDAVKDGMDVINMSLGGGINGFKDQLTVASDRAAKAGVVVAIAAGNSGPGVNTVESPGQAPGAITACASTNNHFFGIPVDVSTTPPRRFGAAVGAFPSPPARAFTPAVTARLANWNDPADAAGATRACAALGSTPFSATRTIVVLDRGVCTFSTKVRNAQAAGAAGVLVVNNVAGDPTAMGQDGTPDQPTISAVMLGIDDRAAIRAAAGSNATVNGEAVVEFLTNNENFLAGFSSRGPANLLDAKPDVCAPGVNVLSSVLGGGFAMFQGTSMATPHVAGASALLRQLRPDWTPAMVKSALVNTAVRDTRLGTTNPQNIGGGVVDLSAAIATTATLDPAILSFRKIEPGSGQSQTIAVTLTNVTNATQTYRATAALRVGPARTDATARASPASVAVAPGESATLSVTVSTSRATPIGQHWGDLTVTGGGRTARAPFWFAIRTTTDAGPLN